MNNEVGGSPGPGIYENIPFETYLTWPYISNSSLAPAKRSMHHYRFAKHVEETPPMRLGTLCHVGRLEPSAIFRRYAVMPDLTDGILTKAGKPASNPRATDEYEQRVNAWTELHAKDKIVVSQDEYERMTGVVAALDSHDKSHEWFTADGPVEASIVWDDEETGLRCKGRLDKLAFCKGIIVDFKTCRDCLIFNRQLVDRSYHRQGGMYIDGIIKLTGEVLRFGISAAESDAPHGVMAAPVEQALIELGRDEYTGILRQIAECKATSRWPGYISPVEWTKPAWLSRVEDSEPFELNISGEKVSL